MIFSLVCFLVATLATATPPRPSSPTTAAAVRRFDACVAMMPGDSHREVVRRACGEDPRGGSNEAKTGLALS